jgi:branched-chain amino acid transport system substrate-binding protein
MQEESVTRAFVIDDRGTYGRGLAQGFREIAPRDGIRVVGARHAEAGTNLMQLAREVERSHAQAVLVAASDLARARAVMAAIRHEDVHVKLFGGDAMTFGPFLRSLGDMSLDTYITAPVLPPGNYAHSARDFVETFRARYHRAPHPMAIFGYEAGRAVVASLRAATGGTVRDQSIATLRRGTRDAFFAIRERASALGSYSIDRFGDTTLAFYGAYRVVDGQLALGRALSIPPSQQAGLDG